MSRHEFDLDNLRIETFNPKALLLSVVVPFQPQLNRKHLSIRCIDEGIDDELTTEPYIVRQIIADLFEQVIKHTQDSEIEIQLEDSPCEPGTFVFMIEARSLFIPAEVQPELFLPTHPQPNLERAKLLVEALSGTIQLESNQEEGTAFIITIPLAGSQSSLNKLGIEQTI